MTKPNTKTPQPSLVHNGLQLHADDNVAVVLSDIAPGPIEIVGTAVRAEIVAKQASAHGHKIALLPIDKGETVIKYGVPIGLATEAIAAGEWVHTHNCRSRLDERSHTLDPISGATTDTQYV